MEKLFSVTQLDEAAITKQISDRKAKIAELIEQRQDIENKVNRATEKLSYFQNELAKNKERRQNDLAKGDNDTAEIDMILQNISSNICDAQDLIAGLKRIIDSQNGVPQEIEQLEKKNKADSLALAQLRINVLKDSYNEQAEALAKTVVDIINLSYEIKGPGHYDAIDDLGECDGPFCCIPKFLPGGKYSKAGSSFGVKSTYERFFFHRISAVRDRVVRN